MTTKLIAGIGSAVILAVLLYSFITLLFVK
jgi:hypothetical protein